MRKLMIRVHELAKKINIDSKKIIDFLEKKGQSVKSHMSGIDEKYVLEIERHFAVTKDSQEKIIPARPEHQSVQKPVVTTDKPISPKTEDINKKAEKHGTSPKVITDKIPEPENLTLPKSGTVSTTVEVTIPIQVRDLAQLMDVTLNVVIVELMKMGVMLGANDLIHDRDLIVLIGHELKKEIIVKELTANTKTVDTLEKILPKIVAALPVELEEDTSKFKLVPRAPVVTFMGHVDHGKTTILDKIRSTRVADKEYGGITQHIGAYDITHNGKKIIFIDTPGHAAFTETRARGAKVTDIVVLVVAADEGMKEQTYEALDHAKAAEVTIIIAINKMDRPGADPEKIKKQLNEKGVVCEEWGGDVIVCPISAKTGEGINQLLDMILLQAEVMELTTYLEGIAKGIILESGLSQGKGPTCTLILNKGILRVGDFVVAGSCYGKVKALLDVAGKNTKSVDPNMPVELLGFSNVPQVGEKLISIQNEKLARQFSEQYQIVLDEQSDKQNVYGFQDILAQIDASKKSELKIILKGDTRGSIEALVYSINSLPQDPVMVRFLVSNVGDVTENDVNLAKASNAIIIAFHVKVGVNVKESAMKQGVEIRSYKIIYEGIEDIRALLHGKIEPKFREIITGKAAIQKIFEVSKHGRIAGCMVTSGKVSRKSGVKVLRDGIEIFKGNIRSLKRFKDDAKEVREGMECGISVDGFNDFLDVDSLEFFEIQKIEEPTQV